VPAEGILQRRRRASGAAPQLQQHEPPHHVRRPHELVRAMRAGFTMSRTCPAACDATIYTSPPPSHRQGQRHHLHEALRRRRGAALLRIAAATHPPTLFGYQPLQGHRGIRLLRHLVPSRLPCRVTSTSSTVMRTTVGLDRDKR
jgi:hypothetical protein